MFPLPFRFPELARDPISRDTCHVDWQLWIVLGIAALATGFLFVRALRKTRRERPGCGCGDSCKARLPDPLASAKK